MTQTAEELIREFCKFIGKRNYYIDEHGVWENAFANGKILTFEDVAKEFAGATRQGDTSPIPIEFVWRIAKQHFHGFTQEQWEEERTKFPFNEIPSIVKHCGDLLSTPQSDKPEAPAKEEEVSYEQQTTDIKKIIDGTVLCNENTIHNLANLDEAAGMIVEYYMNNCTILDDHIRDKPEAEEGESLEAYWEAEAKRLSECATFWLKKWHDEAAPEIAALQQRISALEQERRGT